MKIKRKRGAQQGNCNALKHGFYSGGLKQADIYALEKADSITGLNKEIAILRLKIRHLLKHNPDNLNLILRAFSTLTKLLRAKHSLNLDQSDRLKQAIGNVLREVALPLGIKIIERPPAPTQAGIKPDVGDLRFAAGEPPEDRESGEA